MITIFRKIMEFFSNKKPKKDSLIMENGLYKLPPYVYDYERINAILKIKGFDIGSSEISEILTLFKQRKTSNNGLRTNSLFSDTKYFFHGLCDILKSKTNDKITIEEINNIKENCDFSLWINNNFLYKITRLEEVLDQINDS